MRVGRTTRAMALIELLWMITFAMLVIAILGKLLLDGIYLQRVAAQHADQVAVSERMVKRLRSDALGAVTHTWAEKPAKGILDLLTCADGHPRRVQWVFEPSRVIRREDGRETGVFLAERLSFGAHLETGGMSDMLALELRVAPPSRAAGRDPRASTVLVMLPAPNVVETGATIEVGS